MSTERSTVPEPLEPLEIAAGLALEPLGRRIRLPAPRGQLRARAALEAVVLDHLTGGRAGVSFSGGRDSSLVLAVACHVARREGLPLPTPVTMRHRSDESDESEFQEQVIRHLGLEDWVKVDIEESMDVLGSAATGVLRHTGVQSPPNAYLHLPMARGLASGTLLTGVGGDELLGTASARISQVLAGRLPPVRRDLLGAAYSVAPRSVRHVREARALPEWAPWLTPAARAEARARLTEERVRHRVRWNTAARRWGRSRSLQLGLAALQAVGAVAGVRVESPLAHPLFVDAFAAEMGIAGPVDRTSAMRYLAGDLLPDAVLARRSKAVFDAVVWGPAYREFLRRWTPAILSPQVAALVLGDQLAGQLQLPSPPYHCMMLVQHAWLRAQAPAGQVLDQ